MQLKTYKEKRLEAKTPVVVKKEEVKQEVKNVEPIKEYWLRHPDFEVVKGLTYSLDDKSLDINNEGCIVTTHLPTKDRLIGQGFHYLGYKIDDIYY